MRTATPEHFLEELVLHLRNSQALLMVAGKDQVGPPPTSLSERRLTPSTRSLGGHLVYGPAAVRAGAASLMSLGGQSRAGAPLCEFMPDGDPQETQPWPRSLRSLFPQSPNTESPGQSIPAEVQLPSCEP